MPVFPGEKLAISAAGLKILENEIGDLIEQRDGDHRTMFANIDVQWEWYEAKPAAESRNDPWPNASNVVVPFTRMFSDGLTARFFGSMTSAKNFWIGSSRNEQFRESFLPHLPDFLNWGGPSGHDYDLYSPLLDQTNELTAIGEAVVGLNWFNRERFVFVPGRKTMQKVSLSNGPILEHIPRENIMWDPGRTIRESESVIRQYRASESGLIAKAQSGGWDEDAVTVARKSPGSSSSGSTNVEANKLSRAGLSTDGLEELHDIREVWIDWPFLKRLGVVIKGEENTDSNLLPIVVTYHMGARKILRVIAKPYFIPDWPFYEVYFRKRSGQGSSPGVAKILDHIQRAATTMLNQTIDGVTLSHSLVGKTTDERVLNQEFEPNKWILVDQMDDLEPFSITQIVTHDIAAINMLKTFAESALGISDPGFGRETRMGGHPSPATNFLGQLQQGAIINKPAMEQLRRQYSRIGVDIATLYQQFESRESGKITRALGQKDGEAVMEWMFPVDEPIHGNLELDLHALSEVHNPEQERQKMVVVDQIVGNYYARIIQGLGMLADPNVAGNPALAGAITKSIEAFGENIKLFLQASDVDEWEKYVFDLRELSGPGAINQLQEAVAGGAGGLQGLSEGGAVGAAQPVSPFQAGAASQSVGSGLGGG